MSDVKEALRSFRVVANTGARQSGKTTLARAVLDDGPGTFLTLDDPETLLAIEADPRTLLDRSGLVVVDEFQRGGDRLLRTIKRLVDAVRAVGPVSDRQKRGRAIDASTE